MPQKKNQANDEDLGKGTNVAEKEASSLMTEMESLVNTESESNDQQEHMGCGATDLGVSSFATYWEKEKEAVNAAMDKMRSDWYNWHKGLHKGYGKGYGKAKDEWRRGEWGPLRTK